MAKLIDLVGNRYEKLEVIKRDEDYISPNGVHQSRWICRCDCGNIKTISGSALRKGSTKSCGCLKKDIFDITGNRYGMLVAIKEVEVVKKKSKWLYKCDCGNKKIIWRHTVTDGSTVSCGCYQKTKNGLSNTRLYRIYMGMLRRCGDPKCKSYKNYGGRGIVVCEDWSFDFQSFYNWALSNGYSDDLSIERINNNGNYEPSNCKWATRIEQNNNTRRNKYV